jgi:hypothetical protein
MRAETGETRFKMGREDLFKVFSIENLVPAALWHPQWAFRWDHPFWKYFPTIQKIHHTFTFKWRSLDMAGIMKEETVFLPLAARGMLFKADFPVKDLESDGRVRVVSLSVFSFGDI